MTKHSTSEVSPYYLQMARHWRMGAQSSDRIRMRLLQRGVTWEQALKIIDVLDEEEKASAGFLAGRILLNRPRLIMRRSILGGSMFRPYVPQARTWLVSYSAMLVLGLLALLVYQLMNRPVLQLELIGYALTGMGLMGLLTYGINILLDRFL